jgi:hypothetical protein
MEDELTNAKDEKPLKLDRFATGATAATWLPFNVQFPPASRRLTIRVFALKLLLINPSPLNS